MRSVRLCISTFLIFQVLVGVGQSHAEETSAASRWNELRASTLQSDRVLPVGRLTLQLGAARLQIRKGSIYLASPVAGQPHELVFLGSAKIVLDPPDEIEADQLELFTGKTRLDEEVTQAILVINHDQAIEAILARPSREVEDAQQLAEAEALYTEWKQGPERRILGTELAILRDVLGDPLYRDFFAARFLGEELDAFYLLRSPDEWEQTTLGQFIPLELSEKEERRAVRKLHKVQRQGRLIGLELDELGSWDTWLAMTDRATAEEGELQVPGVRAFEPTHYELDLMLTGKGLLGKGLARIHLEAQIDEALFTKLRIDSDLQVKTVRWQGRECFFQQVGDEVVVALGAPVARGSRDVLEVEYEGHLVEEVRSKSFRLINTTDWYPHAGIVDRATYEMRFRWPRKLDLLASGERVEAGVDGEMLFERRRLDRPATGVSFEIGKFETLQAQAGHVTITLAVDKLTRNAVVDQGREEILDTLVDTMTYFEEVYGPYPFDHLTVVTVGRGFSQSLLGFVTLSTLAMSDFSGLGFYGLEDRRTVIAHELAHQWWGHAVGWESYRDQWISEAMASYSAAHYARRRLEDLELAKGPTARWQASLLSNSDQESPIETLGPLVLGHRLSSRFSYIAYDAIVYKKGAVVVDMLARTLEEERFLKVLAAIVRAVDSRPISTATFLRLLEQGTGSDLDTFAEQFIYGTGLPTVFFDYRYELADDGLWHVEGEARQIVPYHHEYRVARGVGGGFELQRDLIDHIEELGDSSLVVPVQIAVYDASYEEKGRRRQGPDPAEVGNGLVTTQIRLAGARSPFSFKLKHEPKNLWLDRHEQVFGRFYDQRRSPKRVLYHQGLEASARGKLEEALDLFRRSISSEVLVGPSYNARIQDFARQFEGKVFDAWAHLEIARIHLEGGDLPAARSAIEAAEKAAKGSVRDWIRGNVYLVEARLALLEGNPKSAYRLLEKARKARVFSSRVERQILTALAARGIGKIDEAREAAKAAEARGADVRLFLDALPDEG